MQKTAHEVLERTRDQDDPLLDIAVKLERIALSDDYFIEKKLYPNIDFYSGIILKAMGFLTRCSRCCSRAVPPNKRQGPGAGATARSSGGAAARRAAFVVATWGPPSGPSRPGPMRLAPRLASHLRPFIQRN